MNNQVKNCRKCGPVAAPPADNLSDSVLFFRDCRCPKCKSPLTEIVVAEPASVPREVPEEAPEKEQPEEKTLCHICDGAGSVDCSDCNGTGFVHSAWEGSDTWCRDCDADGYLTCGRCMGSGCV